MKYKIGDRVLNEQHLEFLFNPYHKNRYIKNLISIVTESTNDYFTVYDDSVGYNSTIEKGLSAGINNYLVYRQSDGRVYCWASKSRLLHVDKDKEYIIKKLNKIKTKNWQEEKCRIETKISSLELEMNRKETAFQNDLNAALSLLVDSQ